MIVFFQYMAGCGQVKYEGQLKHSIFIESESLDEAVSRFIELFDVNPDEYCYGDESVTPYSYRGYATIEDATKTPWREARTKEQVISDPYCLYVEAPAG